MRRVGVPSLVAGSPTFRTRYVMYYFDKITFSVAYRTQFFHTTCAKLDLAHAVLFERAQSDTFFFAYYSLSLSLYLSCSLLTIWDRGAHAGVDLSVCAQYVTTSQFSPRKFEFTNDGGKLERFSPLGGWRLNMSERERESNEKEGKYGKHGYGVPLVFAGMAGTTSSSSGSGYKCSTRSSQ